MAAPRLIKPRNDDFGPALPPNPWLPNREGQPEHHFRKTNPNQNPKSNRRERLKRKFSGLLPHRRNNEIGAFLPAGGPARRDGLGPRIEADGIRTVLVEVAE